MRRARFVRTEVGVRFGGEVRGFRLGGRSRLADADGGQLSVLGYGRALHPGESCCVRRGPPAQSRGHI